MKQVYWYDGLTVSAEHFHAHDAWTRHWVRLLGLAGGSYGLVRGPHENVNLLDVENRSVDCSSIANGFAVRLQNFQAIDPLGGIIRVEQEVDLSFETRKKSLSLYLLNDSVGARGIAEGRVEYVDPASVLSLSDNENSGGIEIARIEHGQVDDHFFPECGVVNGCDRSSSKFAAVTRQIESGIQNLASCLAAQSGKTELATAFSLLVNNASMLANACRCETRPEMVFSSAQTLRDMLSFLSHPEQLVTSCEKHSIDRSCFSASVRSLHDFAIDFSKGCMAAAEQYAAVVHSKPSHKISIERVTPNWAEVTVEFNAPVKDALGRARTMSLELPVSGMALCQVMHGEVGRRQNASTRADFSEECGDSNPIAFSFQPTAQQKLSDRLVFSVYTASGVSLIDDPLEVDVVFGRR